VNRESILESVMSQLQRISPCLWFNDQGDEAAKFYVSVFKNSRIVKMSHYSEEGKEIHQRPIGSVMTVDFELDGHSFTALNGGPIFTFNEAISFQINCENQAEIDHYWEKLGEGGDPRAQQCGWLKDRFGVSWQVIPRILGELVDDPDREKADRVMHAMLQMKKIDIAELERAASGESIAS
jgi:predicted 3-demethylubiquinone-9 3-methyltransferase (glyoxalase superfamily)